MKAVIIGGGINGLFTAYYLAKSGLDVTVLERGDFNSGCSIENAGMITPSHFHPLAAPATLKKALKWTFNPRSPLLLRPATNLEYIRWSWHFVRSCRHRNVTLATPVLNALLQYSKSLLLDLLKEEDFTFPLTEKGILMIYRTEGGRKEEHALAEEATHLGLKVTQVDFDTLQTFFPDFGVNARGAVHYLDDCHLDPFLLMSQMQKVLIKRRVKLKPFNEALKISVKNNQITEIITQEQSFPCDHCVLAAGTQTNALAQLVGLRLPMTGGKGYSLTVHPRYAVSDTPFILVEDKLAVTPTESWFRIAGTMELGTDPRRIYQKRVHAMITAFYRSFPEVNLSIFDDITPWSGLRPLTPDGIPYVGRSEKIANLYINSGHGMTGLGMAAGSARIIHDQVLHKDPAISIEALQPSRY